jgi:acetyl esterase
MAIDEATAGFLAQLAETGMKPLHEMTPDEARAVGGLLRDLYGPGPDVASSTDHTLTGADGGEFDVRVLVPQGPVGSLVVYYHGGGWVIGNIDEYDNLGRQLANRLGAAVVLVNYRKAPEHRYPAAPQDSWAALQWAAAQMDTIAGGQVPLIVMGDSAGGNLSAIMAQRARREGGPQLARQVLIYPVTDADLDNDTYRDAENQLLLTRESMVWFWDHYAPDVASRRNPDASPLQAADADLAGLAPAVVLTAEHDVLRAEGEAYADRLRGAGVPTELRRFPGQMHGFFSMVGVLPGSAAGLDYVAEQLSG